MKGNFDDEHERGKRVQNSMEQNMTNNPTLGPVASGYSNILSEAESLNEKYFHHDQQAIELALEKERITDELVQKRYMARLTVQATTPEGLDSPILPTIGYKRKMDYRSGLTRNPPEALPVPPPPSGEAPPPMPSP